MSVYVHVLMMVLYGGGWFLYFLSFRIQVIIVHIFRLVFVCTYLYDDGKKVAFSSVFVVVVVFVFSIFATP